MNFSQINLRLWIVVLLLPNAQNRIIAQFHNRQDAEDCARFLQRSVPTAKFEVVFNAPACPSQTII